MMEAGRELDALVAEKVFGYTVELRWCERNECGGWNEVLSINSSHANICENDPAQYSLRPCFLHPIEDGLWYAVPDYSTDIAAAWQVVAHMEEWGYWCEMRTPVMKREKPNPYWSIVDYCRAEFHPHGLAEQGDLWAAASTLPIAICQAALKAIEDANK